jgi:hypothetical protein
VPGWQNQYLESQCKAPCSSLSTSFSGVEKFLKDIKWIFTKIVTIPGPVVGDEPMCMVYKKDRIAVSIPTFGVRVWLCISGISIF